MSGGEVFVSDNENHRVQVFGLGGSFMRQWGMVGGEEGQLRFPSFLAVSAGELFVVDNNRIQVFSWFRRHGRTDAHVTAAQLALFLRSEHQRI